MKILLTGADGFTGLSFTKAALAEGHEVIPLLADLREPQKLKEEILISQPEALVHLAAISFVGHENESELYNVNVIGTVNLLNALIALPAKPQKVLLVSSANVYGNTPNSPIDELQALSPANHYAVSKVAMELMAANFRHEFPIVVTRPFNYTGPGQAINFLIPKLVHHFKAKLPVIELGNLNVEREFNDVRMVCEAYLALLKLPIEHGHLEVFNICSGQTYALQDVIQLLTEITGHSLEVKVNPAFVRPNEVKTLIGSANRLKTVLPEWQTISLHETLAWMLQSRA
jgi:nucleoside-diphosphate-sugar epimerase